MVEVIKIWQVIYLGGFVPDRGEMIKFLEHIVQKHTQVKLQNLLNGWQVTAPFIGKNYISFKYERYEKLIKLN